MVSLVNRFKKVHEARKKRRIHQIVPWFQSPLEGVDKESLVFAPRHEASTLELFFDLFFVANLATFTAYHTIIHKGSVGSYVGFFVVIWITWFHITLHDVRFANDSIYERVCKTIQMVTFVGFALVGTAFKLGSSESNFGNFQVLCWCLFLNRLLLVIQYSVVAVLVALARRRDLLFPLLLNIATYFAAGGGYIAMVRLFPTDVDPDPKNRVFVLWFVIMTIEAIITIGISCFWRILSFKKTHLIERMELLTLIVIGEGAIGVTKTVGKLMGKGVYPEGVGLTLCIILILVGLWMIYFDNKPHGHFGTIRQQIYSTLHFPLHLAIVGIVEGAQHIALARYVNAAWDKVAKTLIQSCLKDHLSGAKLVDKLNSTVQYYHLEKKLETLMFSFLIDGELEEIGKDTAICGASVTGSTYEALPDRLQELAVYTITGVYASLGVKLPTDDNLLQVALESWRTIYFYFWMAFMVVIGCFMGHILLVRRNKADIFDWVGLIIRGAGFIVALIFVALGTKADRLYDIVDAPYVLPIPVAILFGIVLTDRLSKWVANKMNRRSGEPLIDDETEDHGHGGHGHDDHSPSPAGGSAAPTHGKVGPDDSVPLFQQPGHSGGAWTSGVSAPYSGPIYSPLKPEPQVQVHPMPYTQPQAGIPMNPVPPPQPGYYNPPHQGY